MSSGSQSNSGTSKEPPSDVFQSWHITDVEQIPEVMPGLHDRILQYSAGRLSATHRILTLPDIWICQNSVNRGLFIELLGKQSWYALAMMVEATGAINWSGFSVYSEAVLLFPPDSTDAYTLPLSWSSIEIAVPEGLAEQLGWHNRLADDSSSFCHLLSVPADRRQALRQEGQRLLQMAATGHPALHHPLGRQVLQDRLLELLQWVVMPDEITNRPLTPGQRAYLVRKAQHLIEKQLLVGERVSIPALAQKLSVPERTLYKMFKETLGISPYAWAHLLRIHDFRQCLMGQPVSRGSITRVASQLGVNHFSRFSQQFKHLFGETPRQFLYRIAREKGEAAT